MSFSHVENNVPSEPQELPSIWSNITGLQNASVEFLNSIGWFSVLEEPYPDNLNYDQKAIRNLVFDGTQVAVRWTIMQKTPEELEQLRLIKSQEVRNLRTTRLLETDWTQLADAPLTGDQKTAWAVYRQALRDVTSQATFPFDVSWPSQPSGIGVVRV